VEDLKRLRAEIEGALGEDDRARARARCRAKEELGRGKTEMVAGARKEEEEDVEEKDDEEDLFTRSYKMTGGDEDQEGNLFSPSTADAHGSGDVMDEDHYSQDDFSDEYKESEYEEPFDDILNMLDNETRMILEALPDEDRIEALLQHRIHLVEMGKLPKPPSKSARGAEAVKGTLGISKWRYHCQYDDHDREMPDLDATLNAEDPELEEDNPNLDAKLKLTAMDASKKEVIITKTKAILSWQAALGNSLTGRERYTESELLAMEPDEIERPYEKVKSAFENDCSNQTVQQGWRQPDPDPEPNAMETETSHHNSHTTSWTTPLTDPDRKADDSDSDSDLTEVSNISAYVSARYPSPQAKKPALPCPLPRPQTRRSARATQHPQSKPKPKPQTRARMASPKPGQVERVAQINPIVAQEAYLTHALDTLQYESDPSDQPTFITHLKKPLPHPDLTFAQNQEIYARYDDDVQRLISAERSLRLALREATSDAVKGWPGRWVYEHFGDTVEVEKRPSGEIVLARGIWVLMAAGQKVMQILDEWPRDGYGEPMGWTTLRSWEEMDAGEESADDEPVVDVGKRVVELAQRLGIVEVDGGSDGEELGGESDTGEGDDEMAMDVDD
jgi:hypothetical protein